MKMCWESGDIAPHTLTSVLDGDEVLSNKWKLFNAEKEKKVTF